MITIIKRKKPQITIVKRKKPHCCWCLDKRPIQSSYKRYIDGIGITDGEKREYGYCPPCKAKVVEAITSYVCCPICNKK